MRPVGALSSLRIGALQIFEVKRVDRGIDFQSGRGYG